MDFVAALDDLLQGMGAATKSIHWLSLCKGSKSSAIFPEQYATFYFYYDVKYYVHSTWCKS
jgi:hypothetical protein